MAKAKVKKPANTVKIRHVNRMRLPLPEEPTIGPFTRFADEHPEAFNMPTQWLQEPPGSTIVPPPSSDQGRVVIVEPDPLDERLGLLYVLAGQRMLAFARQYPQEVNPETFVRNVLARVAAKDPTVKLLVALDADTGDVLGHVLATIEGNAQDRWVFCYQAQAEPGVLQQMIQAALPWAKGHGVKRLLMATFIDPEFWRQRYNFETVRHVMSREI